MMKPKIRVVQLLLEAAIPVLGYLVWEWNLYFILLFYFLDLFADFVITNLKSKKILDAQGGRQSDWIKWSFITLLTLLISIAMIHLAVFSRQPNINFINEAIAFWEYEELGLAQGFVLLPLVFLAAFQQYKMEFLLPARYRTQALKMLWLSKMKAFLIITAFAGVSIGLSQFVVFHEAVYVFGIVALVGLYQLRIIRSSLS